MMPDTRFNKLMYWFIKNKNERKRGKSMFFLFPYVKACYKGLVITKQT